MPCRELFPRPNEREEKVRRRRLRPWARADREKMSGGSSETHFCAIPRRRSSRAHRNAQASQLEWKAEGAAWTCLLYPAGGDGLEARLVPTLHAFLEIRPCRDWFDAFARGKIASENVIG